jgi:hypothetical protein
VKVAVCILLVGLGGMLIGAGASAAGMPMGGTVRVFVVPGNGQGNGTIVVAGAIGDYGKTTQEKNGIGKVFLHKGTFEVNLKAISKKLNNAKPTIDNTTTCSFVFSATAPVPLLNGTGMYKGIKGTIVLTESFAGYGPFYKTGVRKGKCDTSNNATPLAQWASITGIGTVKFA